MERTSYPKLIKKALILSWKNPFLWLFGLLVSLPGAISDIPDMLRNGAGDESLSSSFVGIGKEMSAGPLAALLFGLSALALIAIIAAIVSRSGLIISVDRIIGKRSASLKDGFASGKGFFWQLLAMDMIVLLVSLSAISILSFPLFTLWGNGSHRAALAMAAPAAILALGIMILCFLIRTLGQIYLVLGRLSVKDSFEKAYFLIRSNPKNTASMLLANMIASGLFSLLLLSFLAISALIGSGFAIAFESGHMNGLLNGFSFRLSAYFLIFSLFAKSFYAAFIQSAWVLFFHRIARQNQSAKELAAEDEDRVSETPAISAPTVSHRSDVD